MNKIALSAAAMAIMAVGARADYTFDIPAGPAADSAASNALIPCQSFSDDKTTTDISINAGVIKLSVNWGVVAKYKANAGLLLPLNNLWTPVDFSSVSAVSFKYKTSAGTSIEFTPNSEAYTGSLDGVMMLAAFGASTGGKTVSVSLPDGVDYLEWMTDQFPGDVNFTWDDVKTSIKLLQWAPKPTNDAQGNSKAGAAFMEISNVTVVGLEPPISGNVNWVSKMGTKCTGPAFTLSDFEGAQSNKNAQGGWWFAFTDQNATGAASGVSTIIEQEGAKEGIVYLSGDEYPTALAGMTVKLDKGNALTNPYGGWADMGTGFKDADDAETYLDMTGLKAIGFYLSASDDFDVANLTGVDLKVGHEPSVVGDSVQFNAGVKVADFNNQEICLDVDQFKQPAWYKDGGASMPLTQVGKLQWEVKINKDITKEAAQSSFYIGNVRLFGDLSKAGLTGISSSKVGGKSALVANYSKGLVLSYDLAGASAAKIDVIRMDGSKVASFEGASKASNQSFSVNLARGTYLAVVKGGKTNLVAPFAVAK